MNAGDRCGDHAAAPDAALQVVAQIAGLRENKTVGADDRSESNLPPADQHRHRRRVDAGDHRAERFMDLRAVFQIAFGKPPFARPDRRESDRREAGDRCHYCQPVAGAASAASRQRPERLLDPESFEQRRHGYSLGLAVTVTRSCSTV